MQLEHTATYGVRRYTNGSWLAAHVDRCNIEQVKWGNGTCTFIPNGVAFNFSDLLQAGHSRHLSDHESGPGGIGRRLHSNYDMVKLYDVS